MDKFDLFLDGAAIWIGLIGWITGIFMGCWNPF